MNKKFKNKKILIAAGGSGGHVYPAITIANALKIQNWKIHWIGTIKNIESILIPIQGISIDFISISGFQYKGIILFIKQLYKILQAIKKSKKIIKNYNPDIVLCMGGYVSGPVGIAAWLCNIPIVIHEQNVKTGLTNRLLSKFSSIKLKAFPGNLTNAKIVGNPIRENILNIESPEKRFYKRSGPLRILVVGGSQGSECINKIIPTIASTLGDKIIIWHQVGHDKLSNILKAYEKVNQNKHKITEYIQNIENAYSWADIIISRSGALTVSEISAVGLAALFIPFLHKDKQQYWNAFLLEKVGAAMIIDQNKLNSEIIIKILEKLDRNILLKMAIKGKNLFIKNSTKLIINEINKYI